MGDNEPKTTPIDFSEIQRLKSYRALKKQKRKARDLAARQKRLGRVYDKQKTKRI